MFRRKKTAPQRLVFDKETWQPVLKCSICTGEQIAGLKEIHTGKFEEVMLIKDRQDLELFLQMCGVEEVRKEY